MRIRSHRGIPLVPQVLLAQLALLACLFLNLCWDWLDRGSKGIGFEQAILWQSRTSNCHRIFLVGLEQVQVVLAHVLHLFVVHGFWSRRPLDLSQCLTDHHFRHRGDRFGLHTG